jgi:ketosteroid isomerase-like protein
MTNTNPNPARALAVGMLLALVALPVAAQQQRGAADSAAVVGVVDQFHKALTSGDSTGALAVLAPDVRILEGGNVETFAQYRSGHLVADMRASTGTKPTRAVSQVVVSGDAAWVISTSRTERTAANGTVTATATAETMVLTRTPTGWKIAAIHWSSGRAR